MKAPYNFVPLSDRVFFPSWADKVLHNVPLPDSHSGMIEVEIRAECPIFVRDHNDREKFCNHNGTFFIPGSSVKGMIRNVFEILTFSKLQFVEDTTYAVRDLSKANNFYLSRMNPDQIRCGWLKKVDGRYVIEDCDIPGRISHQEIDRAFGVEFAKKFTEEEFDARNDRHKTAKYKYDALGMLLPKIRVRGPFESKNNPKYDKRKFYYYDPEGQEGTLVLTGQPTPRKNSGKAGDGKGFEFVFFDVVDELEVDLSVMEKFKFAYFDGRDKEPKESPDWTFWKEKLENGQKIPVFFQKSGNKVLHFGLSYLYKLPYSFSVLHGVEEDHKQKMRDMSELVFGYVDGKEALRGRVHFSHFKAVGDVTELPPRSLILGKPRASYYPAYIRQSGRNYKTYMDYDFKIAGWKRYAIHERCPQDGREQFENSSVVTTFQPLDRGTVFKGKIRYFNLTSVELGALLSALTFHGTPGTFHNIGMAKPYGYGKVSLHVHFDGKDLYDPEKSGDITHYLKIFEKEMSKQIPDWASSPQVTELVTLATEQSLDLRYMNVTQYAKEKNKGRSLRPISKIEGVQLKNLRSYLTSEELERYRTLVETERKKAKMLKEYEEAKNSDNIDKKRSFVQKYPQTPQAAELEKEIKEHEQKMLASKHKERNEQAKRDFDELVKFKKNKKAFGKRCKQFIKKWSKEQNHKNSQVILDLLKEAQKICEKMM